MRIAVCVLAVKTHALEERYYTLAAFFLVCGKLMDIDGLTDYIAYRHSRVKAGVRILEHHLHFSSVRKHFCSNLVFLIENNIAVVYYFTVGRLVKS